VLTYALVSTSWNEAILTRFLHQLKMRTMQGIKFYEPEVVGDTPEAVEYLGMQNLLTAVKEHVGYRHGKLIFSADGQVGFVC